jgi:hypothetical protein
MLLHYLSPKLQLARSVVVSALPKIKDSSCAGAGARMDRDMSLQSCG